MIREKSMGILKYANLEVKEITPDEEVVLKLTGGRNGTPVKLTIVGNPMCTVERLVNAAQEIARRQRELAMQQWNAYQHMRKKCGYKHPDDKD